MIAKPREIASYLLKHNIKSGSADNIPVAVGREDGSGAGGEGSAVAGGSAGGGTGARVGGHHHGSAHIPATEQQRYIFQKMYVTKKTRDKRLSC